MRKLRNDVKCCRRVVGLVGGLGIGALLNTVPVAQAHPVQAPFWGPSGLGSLPTTETVPLDEVEVGLGYEHVDPTGGSVRYLPVVSATYGLKRSELGLAFARERTQGGGLTFRNNYLNVHGKYRLLGSDGGAQAALGVHYLDFGNVPGHLTTFYLTGSLPVSKKENLLLHGGVMHNRIHSGASSNETRPMVGIEWRASDKLTLAGDYIAKNGQATSVSSLIARYQWSNNLSAQIGTGQFRGNDTRLFIGACYRFDATKERDTLFGKAPKKQTKVVQR